MEMVLNSAIGAFIVAAIGQIAKTSHYYIAGLVLTFPAFTLLAHYTIGVQRPVSELRETILFGIFGIIPYFVYLSSMYLALGRTSLVGAMAFSTFSWSVLAVFLVIGWNGR
jgi:membrane protein GlpM